MSVVKELAIKGGRKSRAVDTFHEACNRFGNIARYDLKHLNVAGAFERLRQLYKRDVAIIGSELDGWRKQALEENAALDIAREQLAKKDALLKELYDALNGYRREDCPLCDMKRKADCVLGNRPCRKYNKHRALSARVAEELGLIDNAQEIIDSFKNKVRAAK